MKEKQDEGIRKRVNEVNDGISVEEKGNGSGRRRRRQELVEREEEK